MSNINYNPPALGQNPALTGSLLGAFNFAIDKVIQGLSNRLPGSIIAYDRSTNKATVQILVPMITTAGTILPRPQLSSIPVQIDGGGGVFISFPLVSGDLGWVEANDRDISLFLQVYKQTKPNTYRKWSFSDSKFTPDIMNGFTVSVGDSNAAVISTLDGTVKISISQTGINITSPLVTITGPLSISGGMTTPGGSFASLRYTGIFEVAGNINASGTINQLVPLPPL